MRTGFLWLSIVFAAAAGAWSQAISITGATQPSVLLYKDGTLLKSEAVLALTSDAPVAAWVRITVPGTTPYMESLGNLAAGTNSRTVRVAELATPSADVSFQVFANAAGTGNPLAARTLPQKRIRRWRMYVANDCHVDIGYTHYQEHLKKVLYPAYLDSAFDYIEATSSWPVESRFTYPVEAAFMISDGSWNARDADWHETLKGHLRSGRMSYPPSYFNYSTETFSAEEMARSNYIAGRHLRDRLGVTPSSAAYMTDNPSMSWSFIDALAESGVKGYRFRFNHDFDKWDIKHYPRMFFLRGRDPSHKVLIWNGGHYWAENAQIGPDFGFQGTNSQGAYDQVLAWFAQLQKDGYAQDAWLATFTSQNPVGGWVDNSIINPNVMQRIKGVNDLLAAKGIAWPRLIASNHGDFFDHVLAGDTAAIPTFKGSVESWWNLGVPSTAYEAGRNREGQDKLAAAETFATFATAVGAAPAFAKERLDLAWKNMLTWDEHTWGPADRSAGDQWNWKRNTALIAAGTGEDLLQGAVGALSAQVDTKGWGVIVFNPLTWSRDDLVRVPLADLPPRFSIMDPATGKAVPHQVTEDGQALFRAAGVPGLGYKVFGVSGSESPKAAGTLSAAANSLENAFFKVVFDAAGNITSILDKAAGGRELVDAFAPARFNQLQVNEAFAGGTVRLTSKVGPLTAEMLADGPAGALGVEAMRRRVILHESIPRIDIENEVLKADGGDRWDFHFAFPFSMPGYELRHEMPTGSFSPAVSPDTRDTVPEQLYTSATDQYAVNRWIDLSDGKGYGISFASQTAPMVSYGGRRSLKWDVNYNHSKPWIWSMIYNNQWHTNFQAVQPGLTRFRYSIRPHGGAGWSEGQAWKAGIDAANPLRASVVTAPHAGPLDAAGGSFLPVSPANVVLAVAKPAEDNGEGLILRFNEVAGRNTQVTVDLARFAPASAAETDLIENDRGGAALAGGKLTFAIHAHGWKTIRIRTGEAPGAPAGLDAAILADGCRLTWAAGQAAYWEVFRGTTADFAAGPGSWLGISERPQYFDPQVVPGLSRPYWYRVRAAGPGAKSAASPPAQAKAGTYTDRTPPTVPVWSRVERLHGTRVSLEWRPSLDDKQVAGYEVWRDGQKLITVDAILNSHLDIAPSAWNEMPWYQVLAFDKAGNRSALSPRMTSGPALPDWINLAPAAAVSVSSEFDAAHGSGKAVDGIFGRQDAGEWASKGEADPWIRLDWKDSVQVRAVVLYDRSAGADNANGGTLSFSDGSSVRVTGIPTWGEARIVAFPWKSVSWVKFQAEGGTGPNAGLSEIAVLGGDRVPVSIAAPQKDMRAWRALPGEGGVGNSNGGRKRAAAGAKP